MNKDSAAAPVLFPSAHANFWVLDTAALRSAKQVNGAAHWTSTILSTEDLRRLRDILNSLEALD